MANLAGYLQDKNGNKLFLTDNYSQEETIIGTWMGKPLYRRVLIGTTEAKTTGVITTIDNVDTIVRFDGSHNDGIYGSGLYWINSSKDQFRQFYFTSNNGQILFLQTISATLNYRIIVEYTKTTDN